MKISIVTPVFNGDKYIRETIQSIENQTYSNYEHIIIDGASTDNTLNIIKEHSKIKWISEKDNGQSDALNKGFSFSKGEILAWQNADDLYCIDTFKTVVDFFTANPEVDIAYGFYQLIDSQGKKICNVHPIEWNKWKFIHGRFCPVQPTVFWRRIAYERVGLLDTSLHYCMDVDFYSRCIRENLVFKRIPHLLGKFRIHDLSKTQNKKNEESVKNEYKHVLNKNFGFTLIDRLYFDLFQFRSKIAKDIKLNFL